ncbi:unnamed protein product [Lactuca saligna]|uniref:F-box domain-containing protein n=1 Tax=Lactuca saligna TaxID=75948 RepID=A0AA35YNA5_LACSI|nr:unnamed protein product [Lactuca saligna]
MDVSTSSKIQSRNQWKSLTHMPFEVMEKIIVDLAKISVVEAIRMKSVCKFFNEAGKTDEVYKHMELDGLRFCGWSDQKHAVVKKRIEMRNPNILFRNGLDECFDYHNFDLGLTLLRQAAYEDHLEAIYLLGMVYISRVHHQCDEVPNDGEYTGVVDSAKDLLRAVDVVLRLTTNNITFQCEDLRHSVKGGLTIGYEEDEDRQRYCTVSRWNDNFVFLLSNWNQTPDLQAMDRAHSLGQTKDVIVYKLISIVQQTKYYLFVG